LAGRGARFSAILLLALAPLLFVAGAPNRKPKVTLRFHTEANALDGDAFASPILLQNPARQAHIAKIPEFSERNVVAIYPFPATDGSMGCAFKLDRQGQIALNALSIERRGSSLVAFVNGRQVIDMLIDRPVKDNVVTIQRGLAPEEIALLEQEFHIVGEPHKKGRGKKK
jgi:hypothetical protein